ncbi:uncharacterized protein LOC107271971 isoform X2 [Cephus cinctus]|uniref:Uncharacterized protein LOC107271971 isoform X2 n=1 Tax=Cephus cinctus TaxID=211228 RepID=A0AAJ7RQV6_CEPCN|nr:uncharacterized protein LOC107271971 isoform X2 [Cephus cinctus]
MLFHSAVVIVIVKVRHTSASQSEFINVRRQNSTMVAQLPQQVLLLLVLVTGASMGVTYGTQQPYWITSNPRRSNRPLRSTTMSYAVRRSAEKSGPSTTENSLGLIRRRLDQSGVEFVIEDSEGLAKGMNFKEVGVQKLTSTTSTSQPLENDSSGSTHEEPLSLQLRSHPEPLAAHETKVPSDGNSGWTDIDLSTATSTSSSTAVGFPRRYMRDTNKTICHQFEIGDVAKHEFYSPNYPKNYPSNVDCVRVLEADTGMLIKLDFRDRFHLEPSLNCRYDFLKVRDGQYGFSNQIGNFCGNSYPPELTSKTRFLWLHFHSDENIEYSGFKAVWSMIPRPTYPGVPMEPKPCVINVTGVEAKIQSDDVHDRKLQAEKDGIPLDCMWVMTVEEGYKVQISFPVFKLDKPNECDLNFVQVFDGKTDDTAKSKTLCGSIAEIFRAESNVMYVRFYVLPQAFNSTFEALMTAGREIKSTQGCDANEFNCEDAFCIAHNLKCNGNVNCELRWDEDESTCGEHIRQSRENRLDEIGRKSTPCPISASRTDIHDRSSESPSVEMVPSKELLPPNTIIAQKYTDLVLEMHYSNKDMHDIHQSNNVSNATQERLQESSEEPEMISKCCQTRESLFDPRLSQSGISPPTLSTFGYRQGSLQQSPKLPSQPQSLQSSQYSHQSQCSGCSPASRGRDGTMGICPHHNPIPAPPGWSTHEIAHPLHFPETTDYPSYQRFQSPKPIRENFQSPTRTRQPTVGSGERYGSSVYGSGQESSNTGSNGNSNSQHSATPKFSDPRYRAEAVIEVDQKRPFSIESTKSAPDVIATH